MTRPRIGLALGSGSARGWAHIGVIDSLIEAGIEPDVVCGTSIGALVGAAYVAGKLGRLRQWAETATWRAILRLTDVRLTGGGLMNGRQVVAFLQQIGIDQPIESYGRPYAAVATDLATGREIWLQSGPIHEAVRASIALPGILSPARIDGRWLVDGGLSNPIPVSVCRALGADVIIAVNLNGDLLARRFAVELDPSTQPSRRACRTPSCARWRAGCPGARPAGGEGRGRHRAAARAAAGLFRRSGHLAQHHAGPHHPHPPGRRAAACHAGPAPAQHRPDGIQPRPRGHRRRPRLRRAGVADVKAVSLAPRLPVVSTKAPKGQRGETFSPR